MTADPVRERGTPAGARRKIGSPAKIGCTASDPVSGRPGRCRLTLKRTATAITWTATATSKAGVTTTVKGRATLS
jgi:hypothetical protein